MIYDLSTRNVQLWLSSLGEKTQTNYQKILAAYFKFCENELNSSFNREDLLSEYINELHDEGYKTSTLYSVLSVINNFHDNLDRWRPFDEMRSLVRQLKQWEKDDETKKSLTFTKEQVERLVREGDETDPKMLTAKVVVTFRVLKSSII